MPAQGEAVECCTKTKVNNKARQPMPCGGVHNMQRERGALLVEEDIQSIPKPCAAGQQFRVPKWQRKNM
jgi:hypothetical protein